MDNPDTESPDGENTSHPVEVQQEMDNQKTENPDGENTSHPVEVQHEMDNQKTENPDGKKRESAAVRTITLGQMLKIALGSSRAGFVDFETLHNLLNALLLHLGLRDLLVQENGEPLEGAEESPFAFLKDLKQRLEASERELAEMRAVCQELREEVVEMKVEQSLMAEDMQKVSENFDTENFQKMMEDLRTQMLDALMTSMKEKQGEHGWTPDGRSSWDGAGLIVIGNEITLLERTPTLRHGDSQDGSPLTLSTKTPDMEKDWLEANGSSRPGSSRENGMGQNSTAWNLGRGDLGRKGMGWNVPSSNTGQNDMEQSGLGQSKDEESKMSSKASRRFRRRSQSGFTALGRQPGPPGTHIPVHRMQSVEEESGGSTTSGMQPGRPGTHAPVHRMQSVEDESGGFTASGMQTRPPGTHIPVRRIQAVQGYPGFQTIPSPAENEAGTSSRHPTSKEAHRGGIPRVEPAPDEDGLMLLRVPSSEYSSCDQLTPGRPSGISPCTPPPSPGLSARRPRKKQQEQREEAAEGHQRGSPRYCGGRHTSTLPRQPMESLLPDPNKPGVVELVGKDGLVYRGRTAPGMESAQDSSSQK